MFIVCSLQTHYFWSSHTLGATPHLRVNQPRLKIQNIKFRTNEHRKNHSLIVLPHTSLQEKNDAYTASTRQESYAGFCLEAEKNTSVLFSNTAAVDSKKVRLKINCEKCVIIPYQIKMYVLQFTCY